MNEFKHIPVVSFYWYKNEQTKDDKFAKFLCKTFN